MEGFLSKRSGRATLGINHWQRRFFQLTDEVLKYSTISVEGRLEHRGSIALGQLDRISSPWLDTKRANPGVSQEGRGSASRSSGPPGHSNLGNTINSTITSAFGLQDERCYFDLILIGEDMGGSTSPGRVYKIMADTPELAQRWVMAIDESWRAAAENTRIRLGKSSTDSAAPVLHIPVAGPEPSAPPASEGMSPPAGSSNLASRSSNYGEFLNYVGEASGASFAPSAPPLLAPVSVRESRPLHDWTVSKEESQGLLFSESNMDLYLREIEECCSAFLSSVLRETMNVQKHIVSAHVCLRQLQYDNVEAFEHLPELVGAVILPGGEFGNVGDALHAAVSSTQRAILHRWSSEGPVIIAQIDAWLSRRQRHRRTSGTISEHQQMFLRGDCESSMARILCVCNLVQRKFLHLDPSAIDAGNSFSGREDVIEAVAKVVYRTRVLLGERPSYFFSESLCAKLGFEEWVSLSLFGFGQRDDQSILRLLFQCSLVFQQLQLENTEQRTFRGKPVADSAVARVATCFSVEMNVDTTSLGPSTGQELARVVSIVRDFEVKVFSSWSTREGGSSRLLADGGMACDTGCCANSSHSPSERLRSRVLLQKNLRLLKRLALMLSDARLRTLQDALLQAAVAVEKALPPLDEHSSTSECDFLLGCLDGKSIE